MQLLPTPELMKGYLCHRLLSTWTKMSNCSYYQIIINITVIRSKMPDPPEFWMSTSAHSIQANLAVACSKLVLKGIELLASRIYQTKMCTFAKQITV